MAAPSPVRPGLGAAILLAAAAAAAAPPVQDLEAVRAAARAHVARLYAAEGEVRHEIRVDALDPRLRLRACDRPLETFDPPGARHHGNTTVGVRCPGRTRWTVYVPVRVALIRPVVVTRHPVPRGRILQASDLRLAERDTATLPMGYLTRLGAAVGRRARRHLPAGAVVAPGHLDRAPVVRRGQRVILLAARRGLEVRVAAEALADAARGERVRVRNLRSRRVVEGVVVAAGVVQVTL